MNCSGFYVEATKKNKKKERRILPVCIHMNELFLGASMYCDVDLVYCEV